MFPLFIRNLIFVLIFLSCSHIMQSAVKLRSLIWNQSEKDLCYLDLQENIEKYYSGEEDYDDYDNYEFSDNISDDDDFNYDYKKANLEKMIEYMDRDSLFSTEEFYDF